MTNHVFISYCRTDRNYVYRLADELRNRKFEIWIDEQIDFSDKWWQVIVEAINNSKAFIVVMSKASALSDWVQKEYMLANKAKKTIFPLLLNGENFPFFVNVHYIDVTNRQMPQQSFYEKLGKVVWGNPQISMPKSPKIDTIPNHSFPGGDNPIQSTTTFPPKRIRGNSEHKTKKDGLQSLFTVGNIKLTKDISSNPREVLKRVVRSLNPDEFSPCPLCGIQVKAKNLVRHFDKHNNSSKSSSLFQKSRRSWTRESLKKIARMSAPDTLIKCPLCSSSLKAKNLLLHYDRNHKGVN